MIKIFFMFNSINNDVNQSEYNYWELENHGIWREIPSIMPIGTIVIFPAPKNTAGRCYDDIRTKITGYEIRENGDVICDIDSLGDYDKNGRLVIACSAKDALKDMASIGLVDYYTDT